MLSTTSPFTSLAVVPFMLLAACSSSSSSSPGGTGDNDVGGATFSAYCTGTLTHAMPLINEEPGEAWASEGGSQAASGTEFLLSDEVQQWQGYVFQADGTPAKIGAVNGLVLGTDFQSSCAPATIPSQFSANLVLLQDTTLYPNQDLSGTACSLS